MYLKVLIIIMAMFASQAAVGKSIESELMSIVNEEVEGDYSGELCNVRLKISRAKKHVYISKITTYGNKHFCRDVKDKIKKMKKIHFEKEELGNVQLLNMNFVLKYH